MMSSPLYRGWIVLGISVLLFVVLAGIGDSWGTTILCFQQDEDFPASSLAELGTPLSVYIAGKLCVTNFIYIALSKYGHLDIGQVMALGLILSVVGLLLTSFANGAQSVAIAFGVISGTENGLISICGYLVTALWFPWSHKFHVLTSSALSALEPIGSAIFNNVGAKMCSTPSLGWRWAFRIFAAILSSSGMLLLLLYGNPPEANEQRGCPSDEKLKSLQKPPWSRSSKIAIHGIWGLAICCKGFASYIPFVILPKHVTELGYQEYEAAYVMTVLGIMGMIGQMLFSWVGDYLKGNLLVVNLVAASLLAINNIITAYSTSLAGAFVYSAVTGLVFGPYNSGYYAISNEVMDGENVDTLFLTSRFSRGIGGTAGAYLAGYIRDVTGSFYAVFLSIASCFGVFVLTTGAIIFINKWKDMRSVKLEPNFIAFE